MRNFKSNIKRVKIKKHIYLNLTENYFGFVTELTCWANSLVGAKMSACVSFRLISILWRMEMTKVAVFPVPDWAWAITSWPRKIFLLNKKKISYKECFVVFNKSRHVVTMFICHWQYVLKSRKLQHWINSDKCFLYPWYKGEWLSAE